jgi:glutamate synthase (NADPH/NADH) large chain
VLDDFENQQKNFIKVFPKDYKKVMLAKKEENVEVKVRTEVQVSVTKKAS